MKMSTVYRMVMALVIMMGFLLLQSAPVAAKDPGTLVIVETQEVYGLDPPVDTAGNHQHLFKLLFGQLVTFGKTMPEVHPDLAVSWELNKDKTIWTFHLRKGIKFANGNPFNAHAVKFTFDRILDPKTGARRRANYKVIKEVKVIDDDTVQFITRAPFPDLLTLLADNSSYIHDPENVKKHGKKVKLFPVGTGPYILLDWAPGQNPTAVPNPHYTGPYKAKFKKIIQLNVPEGAARANMLETGEADVATRIFPEDYQRLKAIPSISIKIYPSQMAINLEINCLQPYFKDVRVRQALNYAIDKEAICKNVLQGFGTPATSPTCRFVKGWKSFEPYAYNPEKAKKLLAEAGYPNGIDVDLNSSTGRYLKDRQVMEAIQGYLTAAGIRAKLKFREWGAHVKLMRQKPAERKKDLLIGGTASPYLTFHLHRLFHTEAIKMSSHRIGYSNPEVDKLIIAAESTFDEAKREEIFGKVQALIWKESPYVWLHYENIAVGNQKDIKDVVALPSGTLNLRYAHR